MNKKILKLLQYTGMMCAVVYSLSSCNKEEVSMPVIDSVWSNVSSSPIHQIECAYPDQTINLRGSGLSGADRLTVNGTEIDLTPSLIYCTDNSIIVRLPADVATMWENGETYLKVYVDGNEAVYEPFYIKNTSEMPALSSGIDGSGFSSIQLVPGSVLTITGKNLGGVTEVYLPTVFDGKIKCEFDLSQTNDNENIYVIVPDGAEFARGQVEIVMTKICGLNGREYVERLYSDMINFSN